MATPPAQPQKLHPTVLDTSVVQVAHVYAQALYDAAERAGQLAAVLEEYDSFVRDVLDRNADFERTLRSTIIGRAEKAATLRRLFERRASQLFLNYLLVLNDHGRMELLRPVLGEMREIDDERHGRVPVDVRSAAPLDAADEKQLKDSLRRVVPGEPVIQTRVDPALIGGLVIRVADTVYDGSVRTKLRRLREQLHERSTHEIQSRRDQFSSAT